MAGTLVALALSAVFFAAVFFAAVDARLASCCSACKRDLSAFTLPRYE